ncbi:hypothetical protein EDD18DRAFT_1469283 [Armillaria luteobubalina]|uniref:F-box domain-containing protein n=1 Tax=Armillaria luteobubalina TaxID=153913 RepID=A0AA39P4L0_9AGAR|nr:hypothetical protein EDD18DRAFT_1469283 [Armillaria luteobubalina]
MSPTPPNLSNTCPTCGSLTKTTFSVHSRSSRISELLGCNDPPSDNELSDFQNFVKSGPGRIADLDEKIARANEHLATLIDERRILEANIEDARTLSSPIRRVPSDILRGIAFEAIPSPYDVLNPINTLKDSANSLDSRESPWTLAQVSHRWRLTIVNAPEMWSSMSLVIKHHETPSTVARQMFMTGLRLERSKFFPLTVSLSNSSNADISNHPLLLLISTCSSSIRNLRVQTSLISYLSWWRGRLDRLRHITLISSTAHTSSSQSSGGAEGVVDAFEFAPKLQAVTLRPLVSGDRFDLAVRLPKTQILHLDFEIIDWKDIGMLRHFRNLDCLRVRYSRKLLLVPADHEIVSLPVLASLTLTYIYKPDSRFSGRPGSDPIFSLLSVPNLAYLRLVYSREFVILPTILAPNAITALRIELDTLCNTMPFPPKGFSALLGSVPNLRDLVITPSSISPFVYDASLLILLLIEIPLYHLRSLDLRGSTLEGPMSLGNLCMNKFVEMVEAHRPGISEEKAQMETVYLHCPLTLDPIYAQRWKTLIDGGLKVVYGRPELMAMNMNCL